MQNGRRRVTAGRTVWEKGGRKYFIEIFPSSAKGISAFYLSTFLLFNFSTFLLFNLSTFLLSTFLLFNFSTFQLFYLSTFLPFNLFYLSTFPPFNFLLFYLSTFQPFHLSTFQPFYLSTFQPFYLSTFQLFYLSTFLLFNFSTFQPLPLRIITSVLCRKFHFFDFARFFLSFFLSGNSFSSSLSRGFHFSRTFDLVQKKATNKGNVVIPTSLEVSGCALE